MLKSINKKSNSESNKGYPWSSSDHKQTCGQRVGQSWQLIQELAWFPSVIQERTSEEHNLTKCLQAELNDTAQVNWLD